METIDIFGIILCAVLFIGGHAFSAWIKTPWDDLEHKGDPLPPIHELPPISPEEQAEADRMILKHLQWKQEHGEYLNTYERRLYSELCDEPKENQHALFNKIARRIWENQ